MSIQNHYSVMQIMTPKTTTLRTLYVHILLNSVIFPQILYDVALYARQFLPVKFFLKCFELAQNVTWTDE